MNIKKVVLFVFAVVILLALLTPALALFTGHLSSEQYIESLEIILGTARDMYAISKESLD